MLKGSIYALVAMTMVGSSVAVLGMLRDCPIYAGQAFRFALAAVLLLITLRIRGARDSTGAAAVTVTARQWVRIGVLSAIGMVAFNLFVYAAEKDTDPALVGVIVGAAPIVIALVAPLMARRAPSPRIILAGIVVAAGAAFATGIGAGDASVGGLLLAVGALAGEVSFALVAAPILADLGAWRISSYACVLAVPLCLIGMVLTGEYALPTTEQLLALLWLGVVVTACAYVLWFTAVGSIGPERAGLFTAVVPISAVGVTALLGTGDPTWAHVAGAVIVLIGLLTGLVPGRTREPSKWDHPRRGGVVHQTAQVPNPTVSEAVRRTMGQERDRLDRRASAVAAIPVKPAVEGGPSDLFMVRASSSTVTRRPRTAPA